MYLSFLMITYYERLYTFHRRHSLSVLIALVLIAWSISFEIRSIVPLAILSLPNTVKEINSSCRKNGATSNRECYALLFSIHPSIAFCPMNVLLVGEKCSCTSSTLLFIASLRLALEQNCLFLDGHCLTI